MPSGSANCTIRRAICNVRLAVRNLLSIEDSLLLVMPAGRGQTCVASLCRFAIGHIASEFGHLARRPRLHGFMRINLLPSTPGLKTKPTSWYEQCIRRCNDGRTNGSEIRRRGRRRYLASLGHVTRLRGTSRSPHHDYRAGTRLGLLAALTRSASREPRVLDSGNVVVGARRHQPHVRLRKGLRQSVTNWSRHDSFDRDRHAVFVYLPSGHHGAAGMVLVPKGRT